MEFKEGSREHELAEKMFERGLLERSPMGGYVLPGKSRLNHIFQLGPSLCTSRHQQAGQEGLPDCSAN